MTQSLDLIHDILTDINERVDARQKQQRLGDICRRIDAKAFTMYRGEKFKVACLSVQGRSWRGVLGVKTLPNEIIKIMTLNLINDYTVTYSTFRNNHICFGF